jgi:hypothetical protein
MKLLFDDGTITLDREEITAILTRMQIRGSVVFDKASVDSLSGSNKTPMGFSDADITVSMVILSDDAATCYERLRQLNQIFSSVDDLANPKVYTIFNSHCAARNINRVVFSALDSNETDQEDTIDVSLSFVEYEPGVVKKEISILAGDSQNIEPSIVTPLQQISLEEIA